MAITIGQRLGGFEVLSIVGRGGMGEVYRARDIKLKRDGRSKSFRTNSARIPIVSRDFNAKPKCLHHSITRA
jgi:serine/threonine protein kinase